MVCIADGLERMDCGGPSTLRRLLSQDDLLSRSARKSSTDNLYKGAPRRVVTQKLNALAGCPLNFWSIGNGYHASLQAW